MEKSSNSVKFQAGFTLLNMTRNGMFRGLDLVFSTLFLPTFFIDNVLN